MQFRKIHASLAVMMLAIAMPVAGSQAAAVTISDITLDAAPVYTLSVPSVVAVDANIDEATIRALLTDLPGHTADLAKLSATSLTIPELTTTQAVRASGNLPAATGTIVFRNIALNGVVNGVASSASIGSISVTDTNKSDVELGATTVSKLNIAALLGFFGLVDRPASDEREVLYNDFKFAGGTYTAQLTPVDCKIGPIAIAEFKARPLKMTMAEIGALMSQSPQTRTPADVSALIRLYAGTLTAFESSPITFGGLDCSGKDLGQDVRLATGAVDIDGITPGSYPRITLTNPSMEIAGTGHIRADSLTVKAIDFTNSIKVMLMGDPLLDNNEIAQHSRELMPALGGFAVEGLDIDMLINSGDRTSAKVASLDVSLADYLNGIPTTISTSGDHVVVDLAQYSQASALKDLGIKTLDLTYALKAKWDSASNTINVDNFSVDGVDLGSFAMSGALTNATASLFSSDNAEQRAGLTELGLRSLAVKVEDKGLWQRIVAKVGMEQGQTPDQLRTRTSGMAQGVALFYLGGTAEAQALSQALGAFITGEASRLSIKLDAKSPAGLGFIDLATLQTKPARLGQLVTITGEASGGPAPQADAQKDQN